MCIIYRAISFTPESRLPERMPVCAACLDSSDDKKILGNKSKDLKGEALRRSTIPALPRGGLGGGEGGRGRVEGPVQALKHSVVFGRTPRNLRGTGQPAGAPPQGLN